MLNLGGKKPYANRILTKRKNPYANRIDGELNNKVREGSEWNTILKTVYDLEKEWNVTINTVVHKNNVHGLYKLKEWVNNREWQVNLLTFPKNMRITGEEEQMVIRDFKQYFNYSI